MNFNRRLKIGVGSAWTRARDFPRLSTLSDIASAVGPGTVADLEASASSWVPVSGRTGCAHDTDLLEVVALAAPVGSRYSDQQCEMALATEEYSVDPKCGRLGPL